MFLRLFFYVVALLLASCASSSEDRLSTLHAVETDSTLTHAVLILENPHAFPVTVQLSRPGFVRVFVVPPTSGVRQLVPAGPLRVHFGTNRIVLNVKPQTRVTYNLVPALAH